jgi:membrane fusion protein (multidrug efflux system)
MSSETTPAGESKPAPPQQSKAPASEPKTQAARKFKRPSLNLLIAGLAVLALLIVGAPRILRGLNTVSTDDAYVNSRVTFVAPRVSGQVMRVLVDDNSRVHKGNVLVELDPEPFRVQVAIKQSAVDVANANLVMADATVRGLVAQARASDSSSLTPSRTWTTRSLSSGSAWRHGSKARRVSCWRSRSLTEQSVYSRARS